MTSQTKILVIDDDHRLSRTIRNVLTLQKYDVYCADNGASGIQKAFEYNPDLILCDIKMDPVDGYQVFHVLKESSLVDQTPFIFITGNSDIHDFRFGMDLGADDYFVKPFDNEKLIQTIERKLSKYRKLKDFGRLELIALFNMTPNGLFLFDGHTVFEANPALIQMLGRSKDNLASSSLKDLLLQASYEKIKDKIMRCSNGLLNSFNESVTFISAIGQKVDGTLHLAVYDKTSGCSLMAGLVIVDNKKCNENEVFISEVFKVLKKERIKLTESLEENLVNIFKQQHVSTDQQKSAFFSKRENQVLCLSMEGLPIKMIADKLSISDRTVENHRAKLMEKTNSRNIIEVIAFALKNNLLACQ